MPGGERRSDGVVGRVEHLEAQAVFLDAQVADLAKVACVNVAPGVALADDGRGEVGGEVLGVFVGLDDVADAEGVD